MKKLALIAALLLASACTAMAQSPLNRTADNIVGTYSGKQGDDRFQARIEKMNDGTYRGRVIWLEHDVDAKGQKILDKKNPDKSLRSLPADRIVLFSGLRYDARNQRWGDTKIYDPQRGLTAKLTARFGDDGMLHLKGTLLGISETVHWKRID